jgi:hypothetical protein
MKVNRYLLVGLAANVIVHIRWFTGFVPLVSGDWLYRAPEASKELFSLPYLWAPGGTGSIKVDSAFYYMDLLNGVLSRLGASFAVTERVLYLWPITLLASCGSFFLIRHICKSDIAALVGSVVYSFAVYFLLISTQHDFILLADAVFPFAFLYGMRAIESGRAADAVRAGLVAFALSAAEFRIFYIYALAITAYGIYGAVAALPSSRTALLRTARAVMLIVGIPLLSHFFWIMGLMKAGSLTENEVLSRAIFYDGSASLVNALAMFHSYWTGGVVRWFTFNPIPIWFWVVPLAAFLGFYLMRRDRRVVFFTLITVLGLFLSKQSNPPLPGVYAWLFQHVPGFAAFREPSKFFVLVIIGYAVLVGAFARWSTHGAPIYFRVAGRALVVIVMFVMLWNGKPLITGEIGSLYVPSSPPPGVLELNRYFATQAEFFRVLWSPDIELWTTSGALHPRAYVAGMKVGADDHTDVNAQLDTMSVRYIVMPSVPAAEQGKGSEYLRDRVGAMAAEGTISRVDLGVPELAVYENRDFKPHLYLTDAPDAGVGVVAFTSVEFVRVNPTKYVVRLPSTDRPLYLNFSERFHEGWKLGGSGETASRAKSALEMNSFLILPGTARTLTLNFAPQKYLNIGFSVSVATLVACIGYLLYDWRKRYVQAHPTR